MDIGGPRISLVAASRNDDHGGDLLKRMQIFVDAWAAQCRRFDIDAELILVEWNPPPDRPRLIEALQWPDPSPPIRIIEVPEEVHRRFAHSEQLPLFQMIAKNAGIRRAGGRFVLATNIDLLFSDELARFLASGELEEKAMYRVDRYDVAEDVPLGKPVQEQLAYCRKNVIRIHARDGTFAVKDGKVVTQVVSMPARVADFIRSKTSRRTLGFLKSLVPSRLLLRVPPPRESVTPTLHTNACGDFTMLSKTDWERLRGYAEFEMYSFHIDSLFCHAAYHAGCREVVLEGAQRMYHIEHGGGWTPEAHKSGTLDKRLASAGIPKMTDEELAVYADDMARKGEPRIFNGPDWGLWGEDLPEKTL